MHDPIGYTYDADTHCPPCALKRFGQEPGRGWPTERAIDSEGNSPGVFFPWDDTSEYGEYCADCGYEIAAPS